MSNAPAIFLLIQMILKISFKKLYYRYIFSFFFLLLFLFLLLDWFNYDFLKPKFLYIPCSEAPCYSDALEEHEEEEGHPAGSVLVEQLEHVDPALYGGKCLLNFSSDFYFKVYSVCLLTPKLVPRFLLQMFFVVCNLLNFCATSILQVFAGVLES